MASKNLIISGPSENYDIPSDVSLGKFMIDKLKKRKRDEVVNIDGVTNDVLTCGELLDNSLKIVTLLKNLGFKKGDIVVIIGDNSINYCEQFLACLYMGVVAQLLNPAYSAGELKHALLISKPKLILCQKVALQSIVDVKDELEFLENIILTDRNIGKEEKKDGVQILDELLKNVAAERETMQQGKFDFSNEGAFILMSSGTTGLPKGALLTHANFRIPIGVVIDPRYGNIQIGGEMVLTAIPMFHVLGLTIQMLSIICSAKLIVMNRFRPDIYLRCIERKLVTCLPLVPSIAKFLAKSPMTIDYDFTAVQKIFCGAAPLGKEVEQEVTNIIENAVVQQVYGITEVTGMCTFAPSDHYKPGSAGILIPELEAKVWDPETGETVGPLKIGEFCFRGPMLMKGYVGDTDTNDIDEDGFYHSGDLGYYDEDGFFFVTDRIKELIKYKGFQVSPTELENLILTHSGVGDCAVMGIDDEVTGQLPLAYVVLRSGWVATEQDIVDYVAERISTQKHLHGGVRFINEIPKNPAGKILRRSLLEVYNSS